MNNIHTPRGISLRQLALLTGLVLGASVGSAQYVPGQQLVSPDLDGTTSLDRWTTALTTTGSSGYPGFPGTGAWPASIGSDTGGDAVLDKVANGTGGGPYPGGGSLYFGGFSADINNDGGTVSVSDATPVAGLANVVFQVEIGEAWTHDFFNAELPVLSYTTSLGTTSDIAATQWALTGQFYNGTVPMPSGDEDVFINAYLLQWDLGSVAEEITSFAITFTGVQHAQVYALQLDQGNVYTSAIAVPEPAAFAAFAGLGVLGLATLRRRPRAANVS